MAALESKGTRFWLVIISGEGSSLLLARYNVYSKAETCFIDTPHRSSYSMNAPSLLFVTVNVLGHNSLLMKHAVIDITSCDLSFDKWL